MTRKLLLIVGTAVILALIALGVWFVLQRRTTPPPDTNTNTANVLPNVNTVVLNTNAATNENANTSTSNPEQDQRAAVQQLARSFASIYGSFSTQNNFENITDLYFYMTPALKAQQEQFVASEQAKRTDTSLYRGTASEARIVSVEAFDLTAGTAQVKVTLQRVESSGATSNSTVYYQDLTLTFERVQGAWKVGRIAWGEKRDA